MLTTLANGLTIVTEPQPAALSVAIGFFVRTGARDESDEVWGVSHFLEHMAFKGRGELDADTLNRRFDEIGASYNASTSEEVTNYYAAVLPEYVPQAIDLLAGLLRPDLRPDDFDLEKQVILEEIGMYDDSPGFLVYERMMTTHFAGHPLGRTVLGSAASIIDLSREQMAAYHERRYGASAVSLIAAGAFDHDELVALAEQHCGDWQPGDGSRQVSSPQPPGAVDVLVRPDFLIQTVAQGGDAPPADSPHRLAAELLSFIVGDDTGSRLYWELVDPGHAESCELSYNEYDGAGVWMTYLSCVPQRADELVAAIARVYDEVNRDGVQPEELQRARNKLTSRLVLQSERPMGRLSAVGSDWIYRGRIVSLDEELAEIEAITVDDLAACLAAYPLSQTSTATVGPLTSLATASQR